MLRYAEQCTSKGKVSAEVMQRLVKSLAPAQVVVLSAAVGLANWTNRFNESMAMELP